ncbi:MAG TPA: hypothetical protein VNT99_14260 [Methylomirabilota bacterium]|nr:hypothetical protein [Methylomirabilota bacterium]
MHPSFGVPWPRLQRAAARLTELHATQPEARRVHALIFLCGLKYLLTYRHANGRRLSHYLDDGLRESVERTLPALMRQLNGFQAPSCRAGRVSLPPLGDYELEKLIFAFGKLPQALPPATSKWLGGAFEANLIRLSFGMGVVARFAPDSHDFVLRLVENPIKLNSRVLDVLESFHWDPEWSVALAR